MSTRMLLQASTYCMQCQTHLELYSFYYSSSKWEHPILRELPHHETCELMCQSCQVFLIVEGDIHVEGEIHSCVDHLYTLSNK